MKILISIMLLIQLVQQEQGYLDRYTNSDEYYEIRDSIGFKGYIK